MTDQSNAGLFSGPQVQLDVESINAPLRVAQAQQQQEYFVPSSKINDTVYTALSERNCSITATLPNSTLGSTQHSMINVDSCHVTVKKMLILLRNQNNYSIKSFF